MKKSTLTFGIIAAIIFVLGVLLKWQHWPGAGIALCISIALFVFAYAPLFYVDRNKLAKDSNQKMINLVSLLAMIIIGLSFLFKAMHWPGAGIGVITGNITLVVLVPVLFYRASKETDTLKKLNSFNEAILLLFITGFSLFLWLVITRNVG